MEVCPHRLYNYSDYYLRQGDYVFVNTSFLLSGCLLAKLLKILERIVTKFYVGVCDGKRNVIIWWQAGSPCSVQSEIRPFLHKLWVDFNETSRKALGWYRNNWLNFWDDLDHHADSPNQDSGQHGSYELPWHHKPTCYQSVGVVFD